MGLNVYFAKINLDSFIILMIYRTLIIEKIKNQKKSVLLNLLIIIDGKVKKKEKSVNNQFF